MNRYIGQWISLMLITMILACCGGKPEQVKPPDLGLQVEPLPGVYVHYESRTGLFCIGNELVERRISVNTKAKRVFTAAFINRLSGRNYIRSLSKEFCFRANGTELSGVTGDLEYVEHQISGAGGIKILEITFQAKRDEFGILKVKLVYEIYPHTPVIRKWIELENPGGSSVKIDNVQVESLSLMPGSEYDMEVSSDDIGVLSPVVFDTRLNEGFLVGNEAPGVLKHSELYRDGNVVSIGLKPYYSIYSTEIQLAPNERFTGPGAFIFFFKGDPEQVKEALKKFVLDYIAWSGFASQAFLQEKFDQKSKGKYSAYSVWYQSISPGIRETEMRERMRLAFESDAEIFCLSQGWTESRGDWNVSGDLHLDVLGEYAHELGMKFGLSVDLAVADPDSKVLDEFPQWTVKSRDGSDYAIDSAKMMCLGSEYAVYAVHQIESLVRDLKLDYIRLTGPMIPDEENAGCSAEGHIHRSRNESLWYIYDSIFAICKYLHTQHPYLIVDVSIESYNPGGAVDYALLKYADVSKF